MYENTSTSRLHSHYLYLCTHLKSNSFPRHLSHKLFRFTKISTVSNFEHIVNNIFTTIIERQIFFKHLIIKITGAASENKRYHFQHYIKAQQMPP